MNAGPRYLTLQALAKSTATDRQTLERMIARGLFGADAQLKFGADYVPLFMETKAPAVILLRSAVLSRHQRPPTRTAAPLI